VDALDKISVNRFYPLATLKCSGLAVFRSQQVRDYACLLDVDASVSTWQCPAQTLRVGEASHRPDLSVVFSDGSIEVLDVFDHPSRPDQEVATSAANRLGFHYRVIDSGELEEGFRLQNARDLLRYGKYNAPLGDRVRLLAALDEHGSLTIAECLVAFREASPMAALASLILQRFVEVDLDSAPLGPETSVRRIRN
jgi:hypothetical protein